MSRGRSRGLLDKQLESTESKGEVMIANVLCTLHNSFSFVNGMEMDGYPICIDCGIDWK
jgi:hypothetical protein